MRQANYIRDMALASRPIRIWHDAFLENRQLSQLGAELRGFQSQGLIRHYPGPAAESNAPDQSALRRPNTPCAGAAENPPPLCEPVTSSSVMASSLGRRTVPPMKRSC